MEYMRSSPALVAILLPVECRTFTLAGCFFSLPLKAFVVSDQGVWQMEGQQPGSGAQRFLGVSFAPDARVHQEHPSPGPQAHHPDDH